MNRDTSRIPSRTAGPSDALVVFGATRRPGAQDDLSAALRDARVRRPEGAGDRRRLASLRAGFGSLRGRIAGLLRLEIDKDTGRVDHACDVVLYTEFDSQASLDAYAAHPEHLRVKQALGDMRIARHQVDCPAP